MPKWLDRFKRGRSRPLRRPPRRELAPVEDIVEQGLLVADVAARMSVKNEIIMNALKHKMDYDEQQIIDMVSETVNELAVERERDASHIDLMREEIQATGRSAWSESDYGSGDNRTLRHRQQVYEGVAVELHRRASDPEYLRTTAERARAAAWAEIGDSLRERAAHPYYAGGSSPEYQRAREARIQLLIERDLTDLMQQRAAEEKASSKKAASKRVAAKKTGADGDAKEPRSKRRLRGSKTERS